MNLLARGDELLVLIVEALERVAADAALFAVELLGLRFSTGACSVTMSEAWHCWQPAS